MIKLKPAQWLNRPEFEQVTIIDPDGWDRTNFEEDWEIPLTKDQMWAKVMKSTIVGKPNTWNNKRISRKSLVGYRRR